ncbi:MAG: CHAT domain-containing protein, partial [Planctomycetes bacterium]|nr:CHAT domain-containing protein [Planctomycetota bacterium]
EGGFNAGNINTAKLEEFLANCYSESFRLHDAEALYRRCLAAAEREAGKGSEMYLRCQGNLALVCFRLNQWEEAERLFLASLAGKSSPDDWAVRANNIGYLYMTMRRHKDAEPWFRRSIALWQGRQDEHARLMHAQGLHGLGMSAYQQDRHAEAQRLLEQALAARQRLLPDDSRWVAQSQGMLASVYSSLGRDAEARRLAEQAEQAYRRRWGNDHIDVALELHELGLLLARQGELALAVKKLDESRRIYQRYIAGALTGLSQPEQLQFLAEERSRLMDAGAMTRLHSDESELVRAALEWTLNDKGLVQQTLAERLLQARDAHLHPELAGVLSELNDVRRRLAALATAGDEKQSLWRELLAKENELQRQLGRTSRHAHRDVAWISLAEVRNSLPEESVLVQIVRLDRAQPAVSFFGARPEADPHYIAWTLRKSDSRVRFFDLGPADQIEAALAEVREGISDATGQIQQRGEPEAERSLQEKLAQLSHRILQPLEAELADSRRLVLSPDGALWLAPWAALPRSDGRYLVESHSIRYITGVRGSAPDAGAANGAPVIMADPDFDLSGQEVESSLRAIYRGRSLPGIPETRSFATLSDLGRVARLPATAAEAKAITPSLQRYAGHPPIVYERQYALESVFRRLRQPRALVLSTHGFFLENGDEDDPLLRCGLLLAGCNQRGKAKSAAGEEGILTGLEIVSADLRGTELVVLSACETGLGQVHSGEGVAGLRQAFQLAGAKRVVSTLWQIPDLESARLMADFFETLAQGQDQADALAEAQRTRIRARRDRHEAAHPIFWAAYTVTGN